MDQKFTTGIPVLFNHSYNGALFLFLPLGKPQKQLFFSGPTTRSPFELQKGLFFQFFFTPPPCPYRVNLLCIFLYFNESFILEVETNF